jgi:hypothetical protein
MKRTYEAWETEDGGNAFITSDRVEAEHKSTATRLISKLFEVEAYTPEEASAIYNLRMGWGPYKPMGDPAPCPNCGSWFYPGGSGDCWRCGNVC